MEEACRVHREREVKAQTGPAASQKQHRMCSRSWHMGSLQGRWPKTWQRNTDSMAPAKVFTTLLFLFFLSMQIFIVEHISPSIEKEINTSDGIWGHVFPHKVWWARHLCQVRHICGEGGWVMSWRSSCTEPSGTEPHGMHCGAQTPGFKMGIIGSGLTLFI